MLTQKLIDTLLDGRLTDQQTFVCGNYRGYYLLLQQVYGKAAPYALTLHAHAEHDPGNASLAAQLNTIKLASKNLKEVEVGPYACTLYLQAATLKKLVAVINEIVPQITSYLETGNYRTGCANCGKEADLANYCINGWNTYLCSDCANEVAAQLEENKAYVQAQNSNIIAGAVGAFLGALVGAAVYVLMYRLGYISALGGLVMAVLALLLYEKFGGCLDKKGVICCIVILVLMVYVSNRLAWAWEAYDALKDYGWSFTDCFRDLSYILEESELTGSFYKDLAIGLAFTALGAARKIIDAFRQSSGSYTMVKK
ncbi:MAG: hypothetical protein IJ744_03520 [Lachnospiraceae bacterium]|nr:hypothetical protein [Lachnospiraceae bacterium]